MRSIQVMFDEPLLERLDADDEVKRDGRSAVLRRAAAAYLNASRRHATADAYRRACGNGTGVGADLAFRTEGYDVEVAADGDTASRRAREENASRSRLAL